MPGPIRVDWQQIKSRWGSEISVPHLAILPKGFTALVLAIQERLHWQATYRIEGYDFSDWDYLQSLVDEGLAGLTDTMPLSDLIDYLDEVEPLLQLLLDKPCCEGGDVYDIVTDPDGVIQPLPDETGGDIVRDEGDPPGGVVDWPTYDQRLCEAAARFADSLPGWVTKLEAMSIVVSLGLVAAATYLIAGLAAAGISVAVATGAMGFLEAIQWLEDLRDLFNLGPSWQDARDELELQDTKDAIICAILQSSTPAAAETAIDAALASEAPAAYDAIKTFPLRFMMNKIFNMETDAGGFGGYTCPDCAANYDFDYTETFDTGYGLFNTGQATVFHDATDSILTNSGSILAIMPWTTNSQNNIESSIPRPYSIDPQVLTFDVSTVNGNYDPPNHNAYVRFYDNGTTQVANINFEAQIPANGTATVIIDLSSIDTLEVDAGGEDPIFEIRVQGQSSNNAQIYIDNVRWAGNYV